MNSHGAGWIIFEESRREETRELVSIISPRRGAPYVEDFLRQIFVDRHGAIEDKLSFKNNPRLEPFQVMRGGAYHIPMHIGHDPFLVGLYAHRITLNDDTLTFKYRILVKVDENLRPTFEEREQSLVIAA